MLDVFFYEAFEEETILLKKYLPAGVKVGFSKDTIQESGATNPPAKIISVRTQSIIPSSWTKNLSGILSRTTGFDQLRKHVRETPCGYLPRYCHRAVAEQAMLLWMSLLRKLPKQIKQFPDFARDGLTGAECAGKKLVVVGVGNIGSEVVKIARGLSMEVYGVDVDEKHPDVDYLPIDEAVKLADIIVCSMNLTGENKGYFNYKLLKRARPGVFFVNIARGELSPSSDLLRLIEEGHLGGVALDVYDQEALLGESLRTKKTTGDEEVNATLKLHKKPNVILTPHNAFNTRESTDRKARQTIQQLEHFLKNNEFLWQVPAD